MAEYNHSNSSLNTYTTCQYKWYAGAVQRLEPCKPPSEHLVFGEMAHRVLKGALDARYPGSAEDTDIQFIPAEHEYPELKAYFNILSWENYFRPIITSVADIQEGEAQSILADEAGAIHIEHELEVMMSAADIERIYKEDFGGKDEVLKPFKGIIDCLILGHDNATILDYKFSTHHKTQDDMDMNSQLYLYAMFVHYLYNIPVHNIRIGYIDIPKSEFNAPRILSNGQLSRDKSANVLQSTYEKFVKAVHGDNDPKYNCKPGGWYYDAWCEYAFNKPAYPIVQYIDVDAYEGICKDIITCASIIDKQTSSGMLFAKHFDSYSCANCEYSKYCKPWKEVNND